MSDSFKRRRRADYKKATHYPYDGRCGRCHRRVRMNHGLNESPCFTCGGTIRRTVSHENSQRANP